MSAVSIPSRKMPWQTKAQRGTVQAALAIKKEIVKARLVQIREDVGHPDKPGKPLTVEDAAAKAGVKYRTWQRWEAGESVPYARNLAAIADAFGVDVGEFYDDSGDKAPTPSPFAGADTLADRLGALEERVTNQLAEHARQVEEQLREQTQTLADMRSALTDLRGLIAAEKTARVEADTASKEADEARTRLLKAAEVASQAYEDAAQRLEAARGTQAR